MTLPGPSRTITVEPIEVPSTEPARQPEPAREPPAPAEPAEPSREPAPKEPEKV